MPTEISNVPFRGAVSDAPSWFRIQPSRGWTALNLAELWQYRELIYFLAWRDVKVRYKQTIVGVAWVLLQPLAMMAIFWLLFDRMAKLPSDGLRNLCLQPERRFSHAELGFNFRLTNLQAALGLAQLERMDQIVAKKRWIGQEYTKRLQGIPGLQLPVEEPWARSVYCMYGVVLSKDTGMDASDFARKMTDHGIETRPFFLGMHEQPVFQRRGSYQGERYPIAERLAQQGLYLPSGMALTEEKLGYVVEVVRELLDQ